MALNLPPTTSVGPLSWSVRRGRGAGAIKTERAGVHADGVARAHACGTGTMCFSDGVRRTPSVVTSRWRARVVDCGRSSVSVLAVTSSLRGSRGKPDAVEPERYTAGNGR